MTALRQSERKVAQDGISGDLKVWLQFNLDASTTEAGRAELAPFPPAELMQVTTGLTNPEHFAQHGVHFVERLSLASPEPLNRFISILDFGAGVGRVARLFKGFRGKYTSVDVDSSTVTWIEEHLPYVSAHLSVPRAPLPFTDEAFDCVVSISVFTHMSEGDQHLYLRELQRVTEPGAVLMLTVHGTRALHRALTEDFVFNLVSCPREDLISAKETLSNDNGYAFIRQLGHLTTSEYDYGITFINEKYIRRVWSDYFDVVKISKGSIHDFQDIVTLRRR